MEDGDLAPNISQHARIVDTQSKSKHKDTDFTARNESAQGRPGEDPARYWILSAAFPMIAGTLGPVASAFSICALVEKWRAVIPPGGDISQAEHIPDPDWLYVINAVQLAIALIANLFLLLNMAKRVRFSIAQPITITGWYFSAICLVALASTGGGPLQDVDTEGEMVWSQAFYYGIYAAILYFFDAALMSVTIWGANAGYYSKEFKLTPSQRTLMLQTISFLMYLLLGALLFSKIEGWNYLDGVYWADVTLFTVGYGDFAPKTTLGRALVMPYALIGITSLGLVIGSIRSMVLDRGKTHLDARALEKKRRQMIRRLLKKEKQGFLEPIDGEALATFPELKGKSLPRSEFERRSAEFNLMRKIQDEASNRRRWIAMAMSTSTWLVLWLVGAKVFQSCEEEWQGWSYFDSFYFAYTALTTIGYGDITPISNSAKAFFVFWSLLALPTMTVLISNAGDTIVRIIRDGTIKLGNLTILPGEVGFSREAKIFLHKVTLGLVSAPSEEDIESSPPGFFGFAEKHEEEEEQNGHNENDTGETDEQDSSGAQIVRARQEKLREAMYELERLENEIIPDDQLYKNGRPSGFAATGTEIKEAETHRTRSEYHLVLINEICKVTEHLREQPPRKYSYAEWAWYLRLIGEDEASAETHTAPRPPPKKRAFGRRKNGKHEHGPNTGDAKDTKNLGGGDGEEQVKNPAQNPSDSALIVQAITESGTVATTAAAAATAHPTLLSAAEKSKTKWSWVGPKSPLLDAREEAEWVLERLEMRLLAELQHIAVVQRQEQKNLDRKMKQKEGEEQMQQMQRADDNDHDDEEEDGDGKNGGYDDDNDDDDDDGRQGGWAPGEEEEEDWAAAPSGSNTGMRHREIRKESSA